jgi:hypothetical protein
VLTCYITLWLERLRQLRLKDRPKDWCFARVDASRHLNQANYQRGFAFATERKDHQLMGFMLGEADRQKRFQRGCLENLYPYYSSEFKIDLR